MKYLMLVCWDAEKMDAQAEPDPNESTEEESFPWLDDLRARGIWVTGDQLAPPRRARSVRVRDGKTLVTDGPFAETKEAVGGFDILECDSLEEAVEIAAGHPVAGVGTIEVQTALGKLTPPRRQYQRPRANPPNAIRPMSATMIPTIRLQKIAMRTPAITIAPPRVRPAIPPSRPISAPPGGETAVSRPLTCRMPPCWR